MIENHGNNLNNNDNYSKSNPLINFNEIDEPELHSFFEEKKELF